MKLKHASLFASILSLGLAASIPSMAANKTEQNPAQDRIELVGHFALNQGPVDRLLPTQHYSRYYLYAEEANGKATVIDVTNAEAPSLVENVSYPANERSDDLVTTAGTAAIVAGPALAPSGEAPQSVSIVSFADPSHPTVTREFNGVTAIGRDNARGLIFVANPDGIWILRKVHAEDPAVEQAYAKYVLYYR